MCSDPHSTSDQCYSDGFLPNPRGSLTLPAPTLTPIIDDSMLAGSRKCSEGWRLAAHRWGNLPADGNKCAKRIVKDLCSPPLNLLAARQGLEGHRAGMCDPEPKTVSGCVTQPADLPTPPNTEITTSKAFSIHGGLQGPQQEGGCSATSHVHLPSPSKNLPACSSPQRQSKGALCSALINGLGQSTDKRTSVLAHAITPEQGQKRAKVKGSVSFCSKEGI